MSVWVTSAPKWYLAHGRCSVKHLLGEWISKQFTGLQREEAEDETKENRAECPRGSLDTQESQRSWMWSCPQQGASRDAMRSSRFGPAAPSAWKGGAGVGSDPRHGHCHSHKHSSPPGQHRGLAWCPPAKLVLPVRLLLATPTPRPHPLHGHTHYRPLLSRGHTTRSKAKRWEGRQGAQHRSVRHQEEATRCHEQSVHLGAGGH